MISTSRSPEPLSKSSYPPSVATIVKKTFWNIYDHLGKLLVFNAMSVLLTLTVVGLPFAVAGVFGVATEIADYRAVTLLDYFRHGRKEYFRALKLLAIFALGCLVLVSNIQFHLQNRLGSPALSLVMLILTVWLSFLFLAWCFYLFPLAFRFGALTTELVKTAAVLVLDNKACSAWVLLFDLFIWIAGAATFILLVFFAPVASAVLQATATREVLGKYQPGLIAEDEEQRSLRDLFRPWSY